MASPAMKMLQASGGTAGPTYPSTLYLLDTRTWDGGAALQPQGTLGSQEGTMEVFSDVNVLEAYAPNPFKSFSWDDMGGDLTAAPLVLHAALSDPNHLYGTVGGCYFNAGNAASKGNDGGHYVASDTASGQRFVSDVTVPSLDAFDVRFGLKFDSAVISTPSSTNVMGIGTGAADMTFCVAFLGPNIFSLQVSHTTTTSPPSTTSWQLNSSVSFNSSTVYGFRITWDKTTIRLYYKSSTSANVVSDCQSDSGWTETASNNGANPNYPTVTLPGSTGLLAWAGNLTDGGNFSGNFYYGQLASSINGTPFAIFAPSQWSGSTVSWTDTTTGEVIAAGFSQESYIGIEFSNNSSGIWSSRFARYNNQSALGTPSDWLSSDTMSGNAGVNTLFSYVLDFSGQTYTVYKDGVQVYTEAIPFTASQGVAAMPNVFGGIAPFLYDYTDAGTVTTGPWPGLLGLAVTRQYSGADVTAWRDYFF